MSKLNSLVMLVKSLTKAEKRQFKLSSNLQNGDKDYLLLFELIDQGIKIDELKTSFLKEKETGSFDVCCSYLYKLVLESLLQLRKEKQLNFKLMNKILKVQVLFEKGLLQDGFKLLHVIQEQANKFELNLVKLWVASLELSYISNYTLNIVSEKELLQKQNKIQGLIKYHQHVHQHASLYQLLQHRFIHLGNASSSQQKEELNDLLVSELNLLSKPFASTFESQKNHLLFQAYYLITIRDYKSALKAFYELNTLFDENHHLWSDDLNDYLLTIEGVLNSLQGIEKYNEMEYFINSLIKLKTNTDYEEIIRLQIIYVYEVVKILASGDLVKGEQIIEQYSDNLLMKMNFLSINKRAEVCLFSALIYVGLEDFKKANFYLNNILLDGNSYTHLPIYRTFRLITLLVHFELRNYDYISHEIRSFKRYLKSNNHKIYLVEKIILDFLQLKSLPSSTKFRLQLWEKIEPKFEKIAHDKFEAKALNLFDFQSWIEAKLCKKSFQELVKLKYESK